jgi:uncharacterized protein YfaP (DUF2135 family)
MRGLRKVAAGTLAARFSLDSDDDTADLDLFAYVEDEDGELVFVDLSASGAADEQVTLVAPEEGTYHVFVNGFTTAGGSTTTTSPTGSSHRATWRTRTSSRIRLRCPSARP